MALWGICPGFCGKRLGRDSVGNEGSDSEEMERELENASQAQQAAVES